METKPNPNTGMKTAFFSGFSAGCLSIFIGGLAGVVFQVLIALSTGMKVEGGLACIGLVIILSVAYIVFQLVKGFLINRDFPSPSAVGVVIGIATFFILPIIVSVLLALLLLIK